MVKLSNKILIIILILISLFSFGQQKRIKINYKIIKDSNYPMLKDTITYYYILNSNKSINIKNKKLYQFTFDQDSLAISGYISFEKNKVINFSYDKKHIQKIDLNKKNCNIKYFGSLGSLVDIIPVNNKNYKIIQKNPIPTHKLYVCKVIYSKSVLFPDKIIFKDKGSDKEYVVEGKDF